SLDPRRRLAERFRNSGKQKLILLFLNDFDPEGEDIPSSFSRSLIDDFGISKARIVPVKVTLTADQVREMRLTRVGEGMEETGGVKKGSSRYKRFVARYREAVFELEALPPDQLQRLLIQEIDKVIDGEAFNAEVAREKGSEAYSPVSAIKYLTPH